MDLLFSSAIIVISLLEIAIFFTKKDAREKFARAIAARPALLLSKAGRIVQLQVTASAGLAMLVLMLAHSAPAFANSVSAAPHVFGSQALAIAHTPLDPKWQSVRQRRVPANDASLNILISESRKGSRKQQVAAVNSWVNGHVEYKSDKVIYGQSDRWAGAAQTLRSGHGDCEDYAIAKYQILREIGVPEQDLILVIGRDRVMRTDHAVLAVRDGDSYRILDNFTDRVLIDGEVRDFLPTFSFSNSRSWLHGITAARPAILARN